MIPTRKYCYDNDLVSMFALDIYYECYQYIGILQYRVALCACVASAC